MTALVNCALCLSFPKGICVFFRHHKEQRRGTASAVPYIPKRKAASAAEVTDGPPQPTMYIAPMRPATLLVLALLITATTLPAQWQLQDARTTADLRGIDSVGDGVAWASGTDGTVLRTTDTGQTWQHCPTPPNADHLDFRAIQAFDQNTAIVMSSGKGDLSRLYRTTDACQTWTLLFTNPDTEGFWDALRFESKHDAPRTGVLVGDPVNKKRVVFLSRDSGASWQRWDEGTYLTETRCKERASVADEGEGLFAASNTSAFEFFGINFAFVTGGSSGSKFVYLDGGDADGMLPCRIKLPAVSLPLAKGNTAGAFAMSAKEPSSYFPIEAMIVGGDYASPTATQGTAVFLSTKRGDPLQGQSLFKATLPTTPPHGYRSAVAYDSTHNTWITVGPNGTDISTDDGRNWLSLKPNPAAGDTPDADQHWNALSLPFVVGPHGRIGILRPEALSPPNQPQQQSASPTP